MQRLQEQLEAKNTYMNYYKKEEVKDKEHFEQATKTNVKADDLIDNDSSNMILLKQKTTMTTARNASMSLSGANTESQRRMLNKR